MRLCASERFPRLDYADAVLTRPFQAELRSTSFLKFGLEAVSTIRRSVAAQAQVAI